MNYEIINNVLNYQLIWENSVREVLFAVVVFLVCLFIFKYLFGKIIKSLKKYARKTETLLDNTIVKILSNLQKSFSYVLSIYITSIYLHLPLEVDYWIRMIFFLFLAYEAARAIQSIIGYALSNIQLKKKDDEENKKISSTLKFISGIVIWSIALIVMLSTLGVNVNALVASLGVGSVAIALASQQILADLLSSFLLYVDQPFAIGDYVEVMGKSGTIKNIGLKTTVITTLRGEQMTIPNTKLIESNVHNFKRMRKRRVNFKLGLTYGTSSAKLKKAKEIIEKTISKHENADFDRCKFMEFGDFSLNLDVVYNVKSGAYAAYADLQDEINFEIKEKFEKAKIEFAFPTQTLEIKK